MFFAHCGYSHNGLQQATRTGACFLHNPSGKRLQKADPKPASPCPSKWSRLHERAARELHCSSATRRRNEEKREKEGPGTG